MRFSTRSKTAAKPARRAKRAVANMAPKAYRRGLMLGYVRGAVCMLALLGMGWAAGEFKTFNMRIEANRINALAAQAEALERFARTAQPAPKTCSKAPMYHVTSHDGEFIMRDFREAKAMLAASTVPYEERMMELQKARRVQQLAALEKPQPPAAAYLPKRGQHD